MEDTEMLTPSSEVVDNQNEDEINVSSEENTEKITDSTEIENEEIVSTELQEGMGEESDGQVSDAVQDSSGVSTDDLAAVLNSTLEEYFETNTIHVVVDPGEGIRKPLEELTLTEICLVIIVLMLLGRSILHIIGGRAWNR